MASPMRSRLRLCLALPTSARRSSLFTRPLQLLFSAARPPRPRLQPSPPLPCGCRLSASSFSTSTRRRSSSRRFFAQDESADSSPRESGSSEDAEYERELQAMYAQQRRAAEQEKAEAAEEKGWEGARAAESPSVGFFAAEEGREAETEAELADPGLDDSVRRLFQQRRRRVREAVREVVEEALSAQAQLRGLPLRFHTLRLSSDLQHVALVWHLLPISPSSSLVRLPSSFTGLSPSEVAGRVQAVLDSSVGRVRRLLAERHPSKFVPVVRFVFDDSQRRRRRAERERLSRVDAAAAMAAGEAEAQWGAAEGETLEAAVADHFQQFSPFWQPQTAQKTRRRAHERSRPPPPPLSRRQRELRRRQKEEREKRTERLRTGVVDGVKRFAVPLADPLSAAEPPPSQQRSGGAQGGRKGPSVAELIRRQQRAREV